MPEITNITDIIQNSTSEALKPILSHIINIIKPILIVVGGILAIYIICRIILAIINHVQRKRIKRIDKNVHELLGKVDEILSILKKKKKSK